MKEVLDCWARDPVEVVADLLGNPEFRECQKYAPFVQLVEDLEERLRDADESERERVFEEMASAEWWRRLQVSNYTTCTLTVVLIIAPAGTPHGSSP